MNALGRDEVGGSGVGRRPSCSSGEALAWSCVGYFRCVHCWCRAVRCLARSISGTRRPTRRGDRIKNPDRIPTTLLKHYQCGTIKLITSGGQNPKWSHGATTWGALRCRLRPPPHLCPVSIKLHRAGDKDCWGKCLHRAPTKAGTAQEGAGCGLYYAQPPLSPRC